MNLIKNRTMIIEFIKKDTVLVIAITLALLSSFISLPKVEYIDFKVLVLLFNLMTVVAALKELRVLDKIASLLIKKCTSIIAISFTLVFLTFFSAMIVTNDVALITFVPLTLIIGKRANIKSLKIVIFQTIAANLGSALTPMGNPQNLFIYSYFNIGVKEFFTITFPLVLVSIVLLIILILRGNRKKLNLEVDEIIINNKRDVIIVFTLFTVILLSVFNLIDYRIIFLLTVISIFILNKNLLRKVDYSLLITFVAFFIFIGNISEMEQVRNFMAGILSTGKSTFISSVLASQVISNVPATMLISAFTPYYKELLLGVNIGGLGTLIASLASVISYKMYINEYPENGKEYIKQFTVYNIVGLVILIPIIYLVVIG